MNSDYWDRLHARKAQLEIWHKSAEYLQLCDTFDCECEKIIHVIEAYLNHRIDVEKLINTKTFRTEAGSNSGLHRGYYCPSLVYDIIVGNVKRGKLLKCLTSRSKNYFLYGFDEEGNLIWIRRYYNGNLVFTELLFHTQQYIYGIMQESYGVCQITEERYDNGRIQSYTVAEVSCYKGQYKCLHLRREDYLYDSVGLCQCIVHSYYPGEQHPLDRSYFQTIYTFERIEGFLSSYTGKHYFGGNNEITEKPVSYNVYVERKA